MKTRVSLKYFVNNCRKMHTKPMKKIPVAYNHLEIGHSVVRQSATKTNNVAEL